MTFDQNVYFHFGNLEVVTFIIIYASSGTSHYKLAIMS